MSYHFGIGHHDHVIIGVWLVSFYLCFKEYNVSIALFQLLRFYPCMMFCTAALMKLVNGAFFDPNHLYNTILFEYRHVLLSFPEYYLSKYFFIISGFRNLLTIIWYLAVVSQALFVIGFLTKRFDKNLVLLMILFFAFDSIILNIQFWPSLILAPFLYYSDSYEQEKMFSI
jgi:uncharacterized membrane protein YphA (DoxX/SURF4 family)